MSRPSSARDIALISVCAGVVAALGVVPAIAVPGFPVPITLQSLGVVLAGAVLGARRSFASVVLFLALVALGLPLLAGGRGGLAVFATASVGFLLAWPFAAGAVGWLTERRGAPYRVRWGIPVNIAGGMVLMYLGGWAGMIAVAGLTPAAAVAATAIFIPGDLLKMIAAAFVARAVHTAQPQLLPARILSPAADPAG